MYKGYFFDFDYTLADSGDAIAMCFQAILKKYGYNDISDEAIKAQIGYTWKQGYSALTGVTDEAVLEQCRIEYMAYADTCMAKNTRLYPDTIATLKALKEQGAVVYIVSNKNTDRIMETVRMYGFDEYLDGVIGGEMVTNSKPDSEGVDKAVAMSGLAKSQCVYVGDSHIDAMTAMAAGVDFVGVTTGTTTREKFAQYDNVAVIDELYSLVKGV